MLKRNYFFEFAGMPQSGKTTIMETIANWLKGSGHTIEEYRGRSRSSRLRSAPIADLNVSLACDAVNFTISAIGLEKPEHKIYLLDKGLVDRCIFTDTLVHYGKVNSTDGNAVKGFLTQPRLLEKLDGVFIFVTLPQIALEREYGIRPPTPGREVMNENFLYIMYETIMKDYFEPQNLLLSNTHLRRSDQKHEENAGKFVRQNILNTVKNTQFMRTDQVNEQETVDRVRENILSIIQM